jgi:hypothetical protein
MPHALLPIIPKLLSMVLSLPPLRWFPPVRRWMKGDEALKVLLAVAALMNKFRATMLTMSNKQMN